MKRLLGALFLSLFLWAGFCPAVFAKEPLKITDVESSGGSSNQMNVNVSTKRYASVMKSYVYSDNDDIVILSISSLLSAPFLKCEKQALGKSEYSLTFLIPNP